MISARYVRTRWMLLVLAALASPAFAEVDLSGDWAIVLQEDHQERRPGPDAVQYAGLPITDAARERALSYSADVLAIPERQCLYYPPYYLLLGPFPERMWAESDPVSGRPVAWHMSPAVDRAEIVIWMDGRPHPGPEALHTETGFSTGVWQGNTLVVHTTHMKEGYIRRNGTPSSDQTTMTLYITRHDNLLSIFGIIEDPVYLTEPYVISRDWRFNPAQLIGTSPASCTPEVEVPGIEFGGVVPQNLPGQNPMVDELTKLYHLPADAVMGGAKTMYPEYQKKILADGYTTPTNYCTRSCCGFITGRPTANSIVLHCKGEDD